jgi:hypothetical protein
VICILPSWCVACDQITGQCSLCDVGYSLMNNTCIITPQLNNQTANISLNFTNSSISNATINQTNTSALLNNSTLLSNSTIGKIVNVTEPENESKFISLTILGFTILNPIVTALMVICKMTPLSSIFLSFISYWNLCCLYSILNPNCPQYIYKVHQLIFDCIQIPIVELLGIQISTPTLDRQTVKENYKVNYSLTLDFFQANLENLLVFCFSLLTLYLLTSAKDFIIGKKSILRKYL